MIFLSEVYTIDKNVLAYTIKENSVLNAVIPTGRKDGIALVSVSPPYIRDTYNTPAPKTPYGTISMEVLQDRINLKYICKENYVDNDSFEFLMQFSDGTKVLKIIDLQVIKNYADSRVTNVYYEYYLEKDSNTIELQYETKYSISTVYPATVTIAPSDSELSNENKVYILDNVYKKKSFQCSKFTKTKVSAEVAVKDIILTANGFKDFSPYKIKINVERNKPFDRTEYLIVTFKNFKSLDKGIWQFGEEIINIIINARAVNEDATGVVSNEYLDIRTPEFKETFLKDLTVPINTFEEYPNDFSEGNLFRNTMAHKEYNSFGNRTIRLGSRVPEHAVNIAYYYNTVSNFEDMMSIQETNTNVVNVKYVEQWINKHNLPSKDDEQFPKSIEFVGEDGTEYEGYSGILTRDYVDWDECLDIDQEPEYIEQYFQFRGNQKNRIQMHIDYDNGIKSGKLTYLHMSPEADDFFEDRRSLITNNGYIPRYWLLNAKYGGIISKNIKLYNGSAKYIGYVTKKDGLSNVDPEQDKELILYPDENGILHDIDGNNLIDDDLFYITDKFKDNIPLYYKYKLKYRVYNNIGKDANGNYYTDNIMLVNKNGTKLLSNYKFIVSLEETAWKNIYDAYIYTSFVPTPSNPVYAAYDGIAAEAYELKDQISPLDVKSGLLEQISVLPAFISPRDYEIFPVQGITEQTKVKMNDISIMYDQRDKVRIKYVISAGSIKTPPISADVINKDYALYSEADIFKDDMMIISPKNSAGYMNAKDILLKFAGEDYRKEIEEAKVFKVGFYNQDFETVVNQDKVILYTDPDGAGLIYAKTYAPTGLQNTEDGELIYNRKLDTNSIYLEKNGKIIKGYSVLCRNINKITISTPDEADPLVGWYPKFKYSYFSKVYERMDSNRKLIYSIPEFKTQIWGQYGSPYKDIENEIPRFIGDNTIKTQYAPLYIVLNKNANPVNLIAWKVLHNGSKVYLTIDNYNFKYGYIQFKEEISENDNIYINYSYEELYYHYKGCYPRVNGHPDPNRKMIDFNMNPSQYFTYMDTENEIKKEEPVYNLFNKTVFFFLRPMRQIDMTTGLPDPDKDEKFTIYHKINSQESEGSFDLLIGRIFIRHHASQKSTNIIDTRRRGGGIITTMADELRRELEPQSDYYLDIGTLDGEPYQENSVIVIRLDKRLLKINGGRFSQNDIEVAVNRWCAYGMYHIIEYVDVIDEELAPSNSIKLSKEIINKLNYVPYIIAEVGDYSENSNN